MTLYPLELAIILPLASEESTKRHRDIFISFWKSAVHQYTRKKVTIKIELELKYLCDQMVLIQGVGEVYYRDIHWHSDQRPSNVSISKS